MVGINRDPYTAERFSDEDDFLWMLVRTKIEAILYGGHFGRGDSMSRGREKSFPFPKLAHKKTAAFAAALNFLLEFIFHNGIGFGFQSFLALEAS